MTTALGLLAVCGLILGNGYFVLAEFAYVAARRPQIAAAGEAGDLRSAPAQAILDRLSFMLSGAQLGITVTSLMVGYIAEPVFAAALGPGFRALGVPDGAVLSVSLISGLVLSTGAQMVLGELGPKNLGIAQPERFSLALARSMRLFLVLAGPVIRVFDGSANGLLRAIGVEPVEHLDAAMSPEELELVIEESGRGGVLTEAQTALMGRVMDFRTRRAVEVMVPRRQVTDLRASATCDELRALALETGHSRFPLVGDDPDELLGVVHVKDLLGIPVERRAQTPVAQLSHPPLAVPESAQLGPLLRGLRQARSTVAVVVDEYGAMAGLVTLEDVVEELVGEIRDEHDADEPAVRALAGGGFEVPGSWRADEVARATALSLPQGDYETLSGLVMAHLGRVPASGDAIDLDGLRIEVVAMDGLAVSRVRLRAPSTRPEEEVDPGGRPDGEEGA